MDWNIGFEESGDSGSADVGLPVSLASSSSSTNYHHHHHYSLEPPPPAQPTEQPASSAAGAAGTQLIWTNSNASCSMSSMRSRMNDDDKKRRRLLVGWRHRQRALQVPNAAQTTPENFQHQHQLHLYRRHRQCHYQRAPTLASSSGSGKTKRSCSRPLDPIQHKLKLQLLLFFCCCVLILPITHATTPAFALNSRARAPTRSTRLQYHTYALAQDDLHLPSTQSDTSSSGLLPSAQQNSSQAPTNSSSSLASGSSNSSSSSSNPLVTLASPALPDTNNETTAAYNTTNPAEGGELVTSFIQSSSIPVYVLIFIVGLCGNLAVILVILKFTRIETVTDIYILNLAFADLMFLTGLVFLITTMKNEKKDFIFGNIMCKLFMATTSLNQFASSLLLVIMSFDRYLAVCHPIYAQRTRIPSRAKNICFAIWTVCLLLMWPIFKFARITEELTCTILWPDERDFKWELAFTLYSFAIGFAVPLLLIGAFYLRVIQKLRKSASAQVRLGGGCGGENNTRRQRNRESTNRRIEHLVIGIIFTYTICWLPYWVMQLWVSFTPPRSQPDGFYDFVLIATSLSYTNSALNPILYAFLSDNFKRRFTEIFSSICSTKWLPCQKLLATSSNKVNKNNNNNSSNKQHTATVTVNSQLSVGGTAVVGGSTGYCSSQNSCTGPATEAASVTAAGQQLTTAATAPAAAATSPATNLSAAPSGAGEAGGGHLGSAKRSSGASCEQEQEQKLVEVGSIHKQNLDDNGSDQCAVSSGAQSRRRADSMVSASSSGGCRKQQQTVSKILSYPIAIEARATNINAHQHQHKSLCEEL